MGVSSEGEAAERPRSLVILICSFTFPPCSQLFDQQLSSALAAALDACYGPAPAEQAVAGGGRSLGARRATGGEYTAGRALVVSRFGRSGGGGGGGCFTRGGHPRKEERAL